MTEGALYRLSQRLRLLARADLVLDQAGRRLRGELDAQIEANRLALEDLIDQVLDGHPLNGLQQAFVADLQALAASKRPLIRQLELEFA
jgi:hypothetical protein